MEEAQESFQPNQQYHRRCGLVAESKAAFYRSMGAWTKTLIYIITAWPALCGLAEGSELWKNPPMWKNIGSAQINMHPRSSMRRCCGAEKYQQPCHKDLDTQKQTPQNTWLFPIFGLKKRKIGHDAGNVLRLPRSYSCQVSPMFLSWNKEH